MVKLVQKLMLVHILLLKLKLINYLYISKKSQYSNFTIIAFLSGIINLQFWKCL